MTRVIVLFYDGTPIAFHLPFYKEQIGVNVIPEKKVVIVLQCLYAMEVLMGVLGIIFAYIQTSCKYELVGIIDSVSHSLFSLYRRQYLHHSLFSSD